MCEILPLEVYDILWMILFVWVSQNYNLLLVVGYINEKVVVYEILILVVYDMLLMLLSVSVFLY